MTIQQPHTTEDYLEAVYELLEEGVIVVRARIADRLGVSRAAVSEQVGRLERMEFVTVDEREVRLTSHGYTVAQDAVRRHRIAERFLTDVLKVPWHKAHEEAVTLQGGITIEIEKRLQDLLREPATCPHGNPIPGTGATIAKDLKPLNEFESGDVVTLERLTEDVELDGAALQYFEAHGLMPGGRIEITSISPDGTMSLRVGRRRSSLGSKLTDNLWVRPAEGA